MTLEELFQAITRHIGDIGDVRELFVKRCYPEDGDCYYLVEAESFSELSAHTAFDDRGHYANLN